MNGAVNSPAVSSARLLPRGVFAVMLLACVVACRPAGELDERQARALNALDDQRQDIARQAVEESLALSGERADALWIGVEAWGSGTLQSPSRVVDYAERYLVLVPDDAQMRLRLAGAHYLLGEWRAAAEASAAVVDRAEDAARRRAALELRTQALAEFDLDAARVLAEELAARPPGEASAHGVAASVFFRAGELDAAWRQAELAVEADPLEASSLYLLARLLLRTGEKERAGDYLERHRQLTELRRAGQLEPRRARALLEELGPLIDRSRLELRLERLRLQASLGGARPDVGDGPLAELRALCRDGVPAGVGLEAGGLAERLGRRDLARSFFEAVIELEIRGLDPVRSSAWRRARHGLALLDYRDGSFGKAREELEEALSVAPWVASFHALLGRMALEGGEESAAREHYRDVVRLAPWKSAERLQLAQLLLIDGRLEEALALAREAPEPDAGLERFLSRAR